MEPNLDWLQKRLDLDDRALGKTVAAAPYILRLDIETSIKPKMAWMETTLGLDRKASARLVVSVPSVLNIQQEKLEKKLEFLQGEHVNLSEVSCFSYGGGGGVLDGRSTRRGPFTDVVHRGWWIFCTCEDGDFQGRGRGSCSSGRIPSFYILVVARGDCSGKSCWRICDCRTIQVR